MKKSVKKAILGAVFLAAVNINGCAYGPAPNMTSTATPTVTKTPTEASSGNETARVDEPVTDAAILISEISDSDAI